MKPNTDPDTGIHYGIIRSDSIHPEVLHSLLYEKGKDVSYTSALEDHIAAKRKEFDDAAEELSIKRAETGEDRENQNVGEDDPEFDEEFEKEEFSENYCCDEPVTEGVHEGVSYLTTWFGGALLMWIFKSPVMTKCREASMCVPNAGNLDQPGDYLAYGVPVDWLDERFIEQICRDAGFITVMGPDNLDYWMPADGDYDNESQGPGGSTQEAFEDCYKTNFIVRTP